MTTGSGLDWEVGPVDTVYIIFHNKHSHRYNVRSDHVVMEKSLRRVSWLMEDLHTKVTFWIKEKWIRFHPRVGSEKNTPRCNICLLLGPHNESVFISSSEHDLTALWTCAEVCSMLLWPWDNHFITGWEAGPLFCSHCKVLPKLIPLKQSENWKKVWL